MVLVDNPQAASEKNQPTDALIPLESVLCTDELNKRPRPPDYEAENRALVTLARALAGSPRTILQTMAEIMLETFRAGSAGFSLLTEDDGAKRFHWPAIAGVWKPHMGGGTPRDFGPCGDVLDRNCPLLFTHPERRYTYLMPVKPPIAECLLVPFYVEGKAVGTIWAITHDDRRKFDGEDLRLLVSLGTFASSAYQAVQSRDMLARQAQAEALRKLERAVQEKAGEYAESVVATVREPLLVLDADMKVVSANRSFYQTFKVSQEEAQGRLLYDLGNRQWNIPKLRELLEEVLPKNTSVNDFEVEHDFETNERRIMLLNARRIYREANKTQTILLAIEDITERRMAERELARHRQHLENVVRQRTAELEAANQELEAFSYSVAHDLRAPLRHIDGFTQLLAKHLDASLDSTGRRYLDKVSGSARQMGELIDDFLTFSRIGRAELRSTRVDFSGLVQEVRRLLEPETAGRDIEWVMSELPQAQGDSQLLRLVFQNLIGNALKYSRPNRRARIEIGATRDGHEIIVSIRDNGVGFDMRYADRLFGVFQRLHSAAEFEGTGIGLANVKRIVQRHGGRVWAEGAVGEGACFYFSLPDLA